MKISKILTTILVCPTLASIPLAAVGCSSDPETKNEYDVVIEGKGFIIPTNKIVIEDQKEIELNVYALNGFKLENTVHVWVGTDELSSGYITNITDTFGTITIDPSLITNTLKINVVTTQQTSGFWSVGLDSEITTKAIIDRNQIIDNQNVTIQVYPKPGYIIDEVTSIETTVGSLTPTQDYTCDLINHNITITQSGARDNLIIHMTISEEPKPVKGNTVILSAGDGTFQTTGKKILYKTGVVNDTPLSEIVSTEDLKPTDPNKSFANWVDENGKKVDEDAVIKTNMYLIATYDEVATDPEDFETDNWSTVIKACDSALTFAKAYVPQFEGSTESEAIEATNSWIANQAYDSDDILRPISIYGYTARARLIGVGLDKWTSSTITKTSFTFEFADTIDSSLFDATTKVFYTKDKQSFLWMYLNKVLLESMPQSLQGAIREVNKVTYDTGSDITTINAPCFMFPLSTKEIDPSSTASEGTIYPYYQDVTSGSTSKWTKYYFTEPDVGEARVPYWLRTRVSSGSYVYAITSKTTTPYLSKLDITNGWGIAPAFCI